MTQTQQPMMNSRDVFGNEEPRPLIFSQNNFNESQIENNVVNTQRNNTIPNVSTQMYRFAEQARYRMTPTIPISPRIKNIAGCGVLAIVILGIVLAIGMEKGDNAQLNRMSKGISIAPTISLRPSFSPTHNTSQRYEEAVKTIKIFFPKQIFVESCEDNECKEWETSTIQQRALNHLAFHDTLFSAWMEQQELEQSLGPEMLIQRYIIIMTGISLHSEDWVNNDGWLDVSTSECDWKGIKCKNIQDNLDRSISFITHLHLKGNNLKGAIPSELTMLPYMTEINLWNNSITGSIPNDIDQMQNLEMLYLQENLMFGPIPTQLGSLTTMKFLYLGYNKFTGTIPDELGNLENLVRLSFVSNILSGNFPSSLMDLRSLKILDLGMNSFNGLITKRPDGFKSLQQLFLDSNQFRGSIPSWLFRTENLEIFKANNNNLSGEISTEIGTLAYLETLYLNNNYFDSTIPNTICDSGSLKSLDLSKNDYFRGSLPDNLRYCTNIRYLNLQFNDLVGIIPEFMNDFTSLKTLRLNDNYFSGSIPLGLVDVESLMELHLEHNELTGSLNQASCGEKELTADCNEVECKCCSNCEVT